MTPDHQNQKITFPKGRIFLFIDETGDPGHISTLDTSEYYQLNVVIVPRDSIRYIHRHLAGFRYFRTAEKELKTYSRDLHILAGVCRELSYIDGIIFVSFILDKATYIGPYSPMEINESNLYLGNRFKNFILMKSLQYIFHSILDTNSGMHNMEIVIDRYLELEQDEIGLKAYLRSSLDLLTTEKILQVDSEYCELVQLADIVGKLVKNYYIDNNTSLKVFEFIKVYSIDNPSIIIEKGLTTI